MLSRSAIGWSAASIRPILSAVDFNGQQPSDVAIPSRWLPSRRDALSRPSGSSDRSGQGCRALERAMRCGRPTVRGVIGTPPLTEGSSRGEGVSRRISGDGAPTRSSGRLHCAALETRGQAGAQRSPARTPSLLPRRKTSMPSIGRTEREFGGPFAPLGALGRS